MDDPHPASPDFTLHPDGRPTFGHYDGCSRWNGFSPCNCPVDKIVFQRPGTDYWVLDFEGNEDVFPTEKAALDTFLDLNEWDDSSDVARFAPDMEEGS